MYCIQEAVHFLNRIDISTAWKLSPYFSPLQMPAAMAYTFLSTELYSMPATSSLTEVLMKLLPKRRAKMRALSLSGQAMVRIREAFQRYFFCVAGPARTAMFSGGTPYSFVKYSDTITLSSGTIPLIAVIINLSLIFVFSFFR